MQSRDVDNDGGAVDTVKISTSYMYRRAVVDMFCAAKQMEKEMFTSLKMDFV